MRRGWNPHRLTLDHLHQIEGLLLDSQWTRYVGALLHDVVYEPNLVRSLVSLPLNVKIRALAKAIRDTDQ